MRQSLFYFVFLFVSISIYAQGQILSNDAEISVLTIEPGVSLNDAFGHNAYRIKDRSNRIDVTYGYGKYDFDTPNFYLKFAQGKLNYLIDRTEFNQFYQSYVYYNRSITEQVLNLTQDEKQSLYNFLINNYKPENRAYLYDFFYDNCATKIKDVTNKAIDGDLTFNLPKDYKPETFRTLIQNNLNKNSWGSFGIDLALGSVIDRAATPEQHMFLPENIYTFFDSAQINNKALVKDTKILFTQKEIAKPSNFLTSPLFILGIIGAIIIWLTYKDNKNNTRQIWLDVTLFAITGIVGVIILLLWFATDHTATHQNYNLLWACALNILMVGQVYKKQAKAWFINYVKFLVILLCLLTLHWIIGVQVFAIGLMPLLIALFLRYLFLIKHFKKTY
ncbi:lipoprotein N-acyltransferase Lnb domain-containing protein [Changchengzhania lutea]|uniref:lipoprotein N-acyltransferase Lnb domain-containing protein n=1 Tax=Changchengzhania lutea TaxID=2049305 RepID=UPI00115EBFEA|nr:DUF4105 domain-containing protein [Changchengzhania lutea]